MGFRSRALLTGVATGFLKANNDRRDRMTERLQTLSDNRATMDRERAKSQADAASKAAYEEQKKWSELRSQDHIDDEGNYTEKFYNVAAYSEFQKEETRKAFGNDYNSFVTEFSKMGPKKFIRQYKDPQDIEQSLSKVYSSIDTRQRDELSRPALTGFDSMLGSMVNRVSSAVGGGTVFGPPSDGTLSSAPTETIDPMRPQGPQEPSAPFEAPNFQAPKVEPDKSNKWIQKPDGSWVVAFTDSTGSNIVVDPQVKGTLPEGSQGGAPKIEDIQEKRYIQGVPVPNVVRATFTDDKGVKNVKEGVMNEEGKFVPLADLSPFSDADKPSSESAYEGDNNVKQAQFAQDTLYSAVRATKTIKNIKSTFNPADYGSEAVVSDVGNTMTALGRMFNSGYSGGIDEKAKVFAAIEKGDAFNQLDPRVQEAIKTKDFGAIKELTKQYNKAELDEAFTEFAAEELTPKEQALLSELRQSAISAEMQPLVRDLLRAWTGGDKKPAWGAAEHLLETLKANSTPTKLMGQLERLERDMARTAAANLKTKWDHSKYSLATNIGEGFLEVQDSKDFEGTEVRRNRRTGEYLLVKTGTNASGELIRYFIPSNGLSVIKAKQPSRGSDFTTEDERNYKFTNRLLDDYTEIINEHGRPIN